MATAVGNAFGSYLLVVAVAIGVGPMVERSVTIYLAVKSAGAAYLVYLGVQAFRRRGAAEGAGDPDAQPTGPARGDLRTVLDGVPLLGFAMIGLGLTVAMTGRAD